MYITVEEMLVHRGQSSGYQIAKSGTMKSTVGDVAEFRDIV